MSLLYFLFRLIMRKEAFFTLNRILLLTIVVSSSTIPLIHLSKGIQTPVQKELMYALAPTIPEVVSLSEDTNVIGNSLIEKSLPDKVNSDSVISSQQLILFAYLLGLCISFLIFLHGLVNILMLFRKAKFLKMDGFWLLVMDKDISAFSFGRFVILSKSDYEEHSATMLAHEQAHIRLNHFYDLLLLETIKIFHWFNPFIYRLVKDMKEIHEFQADDYTLTKGIDATQYQLLIIQKCVGSRRFALANSFNHCQIKKRLVMINKQKPSKAWSWKVATFLPLLALLLMAFGKTEENSPPGGSSLSSIRQVFSNDSTKQWREADFLSLKQFNAMKENGKTPKWVEPDWGISTENGKTLTIKKSDFSGSCVYIVKIDSHSQILVSNNKRRLGWNELQDSILPWVDYAFADDRSKHHFYQSMVNGKLKMGPNCIFLISRDLNTPVSDYQRLLNIIGNTVLEIRKKYSRDIYNLQYSKLNSGQREQIDILIPLVAMIAQPKKLRQEPKITKDSLATRSKQNENYEIFQADKFVTNSDKPSIIYLYNAQVKFNDWKLTAAYIEINNDSSLILAKGTKDSTGIILGKPLLSQDKQEFTATEIRFNFKTKKGVINGDDKITKF